MKRVIRQRQLTNRGTGGQSLIEFVIAVTAVIPIALLGMDSLLILYGLQLNHDTCREAARSASSGDPRLALIRASQVVARARAGAHVCVTLEQVNTSVSKEQLESMAPYGGEVNGLVDITTTVQVKPFILGWFMGRELCLHMDSSQEVPITYVLPNQLEKASQPEQNQQSQDPGNLDICTYRNTEP
jgi:hypothetical protein